MKVFNPFFAQVIMFVIPRKYEEVLNIKIRHELKDTTTIIDTFESGIDNGYLQLAFTLKSKEGASYEIEVNGITTLLWRGKGYATNKTDLENYKLL